MLQLRPEYSELDSHIVFCLQSDKKFVDTYSDDKFVFEDGSYISNLATKIIEGGYEEFEKTFKSNMPTDESTGLSQSWPLNEIDSDKQSFFQHLSSPRDTFNFILKNQGKESATRDIHWLLLKFPKCLPDEIVGWMIPDFEEEIPEDGRIFLVKKV